MNIQRNISVLLLLFAMLGTVRGQNAAVKTNLLYDAALNANAGIEVKLARKWSLDLSGQVNLWTINNHKWKHWMAQPEARYWFCQPFMKSFIGFHAIGGEYNVGNIRNSVSFLGTDFSKLTDHRYEGWAIGGGIAYGYALALSKHWDFEFEIGIGYIYTEFTKYSCAECSHELGKGHHHYYGPTKAAVNLVYVF